MIGSTEEPGAAQSDHQINRVVGKRLHDERRHANLTLQDVARLSGLSVGMISKVENGQTSPSLRTLGRLASALDIPVTTFFRGLEEEQEASFVKKGKGIELLRRGSGDGQRYELLAASKGPRRQIKPFLVSLTEEHGSFPLFQHDGVEFMFMLEGRLAYRFGRHVYEMEPGDSLLIEGSVPHAPERLDALPITYLSVEIKRDDEDTDRLVRKR